MQGLVTLDFGNSHPHAGLFQKNQGSWGLIKVAPLVELPLYLQQLGMSAHNTSVVVCEVRPREEELTKLMEQGFLVTRVKDYWRGKRFAGMPVDYAATLGEDRLIEAFFAFKKEKISQLIIDAGTFVTMDVVTENGFEGGYIIPGLNAFCETFGKGEQLKAVSLEALPSFALPKDTAGAMIGSYTAFAALAKKLVLERGLRKIVITGGQGEIWRGFFEDLGDAPVVEITPHLIHWALHFWMTTQIEPQ